MEVLVLGPYVLWKNGGFFTRQSCSMTGLLRKHANPWLK